MGQTKLFIYNFVLQYFTKNTLFHKWVATALVISLLFINIWFCFDNFLHSLGTTWVPGGIITSLFQVQVHPLRTELWNI